MHLKLVEKKVLIEVLDYQINSEIEMAKVNNEEPVFAKHLINIYRKIKLLKKDQLNKKLQKWKEAMYEIDF